MEFVILIIGIIVVLTSLGNRSLSNFATERDMMKIAEAKDKLDARKPPPYPFIPDIQKKIRNREIKIDQELHENYVRIFGEDYFEKYSIEMPYTGKKILSVPISDDWKLTLYIAKLGYYELPIHMKLSITPERDVIGKAYFKELESVFHAHGIDAHFGLWTNPIGNAGSEVLVVEEHKPGKVTRMF